MTTELATRKGYDLYLEQDGQGPTSSDLIVFTVEGDDSVSLHVHQDEVEEYEFDHSDEPALLSDELDRPRFDKLLTWLDVNCEGGVHHCDHWTWQDDDTGFAYHLNQRHRAALAELNSENFTSKLDAAQKCGALEAVAKLYGIKL